MSDSYLLLTPALTFLVVLLAGFVGCNWFYDIEETAPYPPPVLPTPPTGLTAMPRDHAVDLSWDAHAGADKITVRMGETSGDHPISIDRPADSTAYSWTGLNNDQPYYFALTTTVGSMVSVESEEVSAIPGLYGVVLPFLEQLQLGSLRNFDAWMGVRITTGPNNLTLRSLGRWFDAALTGTHAVRIAAASDPTNVLATVMVIKSAPSATDGFVYADLANTIPLTANTQYFVTSRETPAGDPFHDSDFTRVDVIDSNAGAEVRAAFGDDAGSYTVDPVVAAAYGPVNLQYTRP